MNRPRVIFLAAVTLAVLAALSALFIFSGTGPAGLVKPAGVSGSSVRGADMASSSATAPFVSVPPSVSPDAQLSNPRNSPAPSFNPNAKAAIAADLITGQTLYEFNAETRWPLASITKLMTAQIVLDLMNADDFITLAEEDFSSGGSSLTANLQPGDRYRISDLLKVLLVPSSNEAAKAFARSYGYSAFIGAMNAKARIWNLQNTHFDDSSGISVANQSTPREFAELARRIYLSHPEIFDITRSGSVAVQEMSTGIFKQFYSTNNFAGRYGFLGGKTGTTPEAGDNLVSVFQMNSNPAIFVIFGAKDRYAVTESLLQLVQ